jgi:hypothetical protein
MEAKIIDVTKYVIGFRSNARPIIPEKYRIDTATLQDALKPRSITITVRLRRIELLTFSTPLRPARNPFSRN